MSTTIFRFPDELAYSRTRNPQMIHVVSQACPGAFFVHASTPEQDKQGSDFTAAYVSSARINIEHIDIKERRPGCKTHWKGGVPDLCLEFWSVMPGGRYGTPLSQSKIGWTLNATSITTHALFVYDPDDCMQAFLVPFDPLRRVFQEQKDTWRRIYPTYVQRNVNHESESVFVPIGVVQAAGVTVRSFTVDWAST